MDNILNKFKIKAWKKTVGKPVAKTFTIDRPLSRLKIIPHDPLPDSLTTRFKEEERNKRLSFYERQSYESRRLFELEHLKTLGLTQEEYNKAVLKVSKSRYDRYKGIANDLITPIDPSTFTLPCRVRVIHVQECLKYICAELNDSLPIGGNYEALAGEAFTVVEGDFPKFSNYDHVPEYVVVTPAGTAVTVYNISDGFIRVSTSLQATQMMTIKEIGVYFTGGIYWSVNGAKVFGPDKYGELGFWSEFDVRSVDPDGTQTHLISTANRRKVELYRKTYSETPFMNNNWQPIARKVTLDLHISPNHSFLVDYLIEYYEKSEDAYGDVTVSFKEFSIFPYIIYESCGYEWVEVYTLRIQ